MTAAMTRDDVSAFDATRARHVAERWFVVVPGIVGAAAHAAGTVAGTVARERASEPAGRERVARFPEPSRPSSPNGSIDVVHDDVHDRHHEHDVTPRVRTFLRRFRVSDVAIASFARWAQGPLHLLASVVSLDGSWTAAAAAGNAASLASAAVSAASPTLSENYVVSESLEGVESLRSDLFATCPAADGPTSARGDDESVRGRRRVHRRVRVVERRAHRRGGVIPRVFVRVDRRITSETSSATRRERVTDDG